MQKIERYCTLCGNEKVTEDKPCAKCSAVLRGPLKKAYKLWREARDNFGMCCGGISRSPKYSGDAPAPYLYFHGDDFNDVYPKVTRGKRKGQEPRRGPYVAVEHGIDFFADHAECWYRHDTGNDVGSTDYGESVPYTDPDFWKTLSKNWDHAAESAFNDDWLSCRKCGNHFFEHCGCDEKGDW